jgi:predicted nucleic acid-binding protein
MSDGPYLFDVGVVALAHAGTPVSESALTHVRDAIRGTIDAVVPYTVLVGAHHVLTSFYGFSNERASQLMHNLMDAKRIHWYDQLPEDVVRTGFSLAGEANVDGWDGYYAAVARSEGVETILTLDDDFESVDGLSAEVVLTPDEFVTLNDYLGH